MKPSSLHATQRPAGAFAPESTTLTHIWDSEETRLVPIDRVIPSKESEIQALRRRLAEAYQTHKRDPGAGHALWLCPLCWEPLLLAGKPRGDGFYVRHRSNPAFDCPFKNGGVLSLDQLDALRFNGQKESPRHIHLKQTLHDMLQSWGKADFVEVESTVHGLDKLNWRRPDILTAFNGQTVAIEIQLSSTYLDVIVGREQFYRENGIFVLWIFDRFTYQGHRLYEKDIYYQHNGNAFELTDEALQVTRESGIPHLTCHYLEPHLADGNVRTAWKQATVPLPEVTFCQETFRVFWFDSEAAREKLEGERQLQALLSHLRSLIAEPRSISSRKAEIEAVIADIYRAADIRASVPALDDGAVRVLEVIISAQQGELVGELGLSSKNNWASWANTVFEHYTGYVKAFLRVTEHYGVDRHFSDRRPWQKKKVAVIERRKRGENSERVEWWPLFKRLAPECNWEHR